MRAYETSYRFSHIYAEHEAFDYPLAKEILSRFPEAVVIAVDNYKQIFNRRRQNADVQRRRQALVLALKRPPFLYDLSENCQTFGYPNSYYTTPMINCLYNCDYCYLHGKTETANIVLFVNVDDFFSETGKTVQERSLKGQSVQVNLSYDTDLLVFEKWTGLLAKWVAFTKETPRLIAELRTKSASYTHLRKVAPSERFVLAWSLSPEAVSMRYEHRAPSFSKRLSNIKQAAKDGWPIRLCFDPVVPIENWREIYKEMFETVFAVVDNSAINGVAAGVFRMGETYFKRVKKQRPHCDLFYMDHVGQSGAVEKAVFEQLARHMPKEKIEIWK